ncbi:hypothetical protein ES703_92773 [subsurface metagenome]
MCGQHNQILSDIIVNIANTVRQSTFPICFATVSSQFDNLKPVFLYVPFPLCYHMIVWTGYDCNNFIFL